MRMNEIQKMLAARECKTSRRLIQLWAQRGLISAPSGTTRGAEYPDYILFEIFAAMHMISRAFGWHEVRMARHALLKSVLNGSDPAVIFETRPWRTMKKELAHWLLGWATEALSLPWVENVRVECWAEGGKLVFRQYEGESPYPANIHPQPHEFIVFRRAPSD